MAEPFNVKAVSRMSGVSAHTMRAWERRYKAIVPERSPSGRRVYSAADVERLKILQQLVGRGHSISGIARLPLEKLQALLERELPKPTTRARSTETSESITHLVDCIRNFDLEQLSEEMLRARTTFDLRTFIFEIVSGLLNEVGERVRKRTLSVAQEHALSAILRDHLGQMTQALKLRKPGALTVALTTPEGDLHEFGILLSALLCLSRGIRVEYLGVNLPAIDLLHALTKLKPNVLLVGALELPADEPRVAIQEYLRKIDAQASTEIEIWIGGNAMVTAPRFRSKRQAKHFDSLQALDAHLAKL